MNPWMVLAFLIFIGSQPAAAFPELVRHGYSNCMTCHVSPTGGGVLTEYGRALSKEIVSTWGFEGEENFLYWLSTNQNLALGGDIRWLHINDKTPDESDSRSIFMQRDVEIAVTHGAFTAATTAGIETSRLTDEDEFISRRHFLMYRPTPTTSVRAGRFYPEFGLYIPEHTSVIRRGLGWDQGAETYNLEGAWQSEELSAFVTAIFGRPDDTDIKREKGATATVWYSPTMGHKIGGSYYYGETDEVIHHYIGPQAIFGFTEHFFLLAQITGIRTFPYTAEEAHWGMVDYLRLNYELVQGLHVYLAQEFMQSDLESNLTRRDIFSLGVQFFPRPHWELQVIGQKLYSQGLSNDPVNRVSFYLHYYL